uniref:Uncharacterized protein n=1 Tax=Rhizophora mucronata TaxID=61149 RepID=A0A2P2LSF9_RHIMU
MCCTSSDFRGTGDGKHTPVTSDLSETTILQVSEARESASGDSVFLSKRDLSGNKVLSRHWISSPSTS